MNSDKKYLNSLINFELTNAKAKITFSNGNPLNLKHEDREAKKAGDVVNKNKPKKNPSSTSKVQFDTIDATLSADIEVPYLGGFFDSDEGYEESESLSNEDEKPKDEKEETEETKDANENEEKEEEKIEETQESSISILGISVVINEDYFSNELQGVVSVVCENEEKISILSQNIAINVPLSYLNGIDYNDYAQSFSSNKKRTQESIISNIISKQRSNIVHNEPFYRLNSSQKSIVSTLSGKFDLPETIKTIL